VSTARSRVGSLPAPLAGPLVAPLVIYVVTRLVAAGFVLLTAPGRVVRLEQIPGYHATVVGSLPPDYATVMTSWDAQWYWDIVLHGYASTPLGTDGLPAQTNLAFFPLYPELVGLLTRLSGLGFEVVAPTLSLVVGAAAICVVYVLVADRLDRRRALACVALLCCFVSAPILQAAYTESLALLLVATFLLLLARRRYAWALLPLLLLGLTRNIALAMAPVVVAHWVVQVVHARRGDEQQRVQHLRLGILTAGTLAATAAWPLLAGVIGGRADAYVTTVKAWPGFTGSALRPPWAAALTDAGVLAWVLALVLLAVLAALLLTPTVRAWGPELWAWTASSVGFVILTTSATTSLARYLLLAFPLGLVLVPATDDRSSRRLQHVVVAVVCLLGLAAQFLWVDKLLVFAGPDGGWGYP
jgi:hypothetical protein